MKIFSKSLLIFPLLFVFCSCNNSSTEPKPKETDNRQLEVYIPNTKGEYFTCNYGLDPFYNDSTTYNKDLALLSLGFSLAASQKASIDKFYRDLEYTTVYKSDNYDSNESEQYDSFVIGKKEYNDFVILSLSARSYYYCMQWSANFHVGLEGNAIGFENSAEKMHEELKSVVSTQQKKVKIWLSGYSRSAALMQNLTSKIMEDKSMKVDMKDLYVYNFEAPSTIETQNVKQYKNVFNHASSNDFISKFYPSSFGMSQNGVFLDIFDKEVTDKLIEEGDFKPFISSDDFQNEAEYVAYLISRLTTYTSEKEDALMNSRAAFANNYQDGLGYIVGIMVTLYDHHPDSAEEMIETINSYSLFQKIALFKSNKLYNFITPYLDENHVNYDETKLRASCDCIEKFATAYLSLILEVVVPYVDNFTRLSLFHEAKTTYLLLKKYHETHDNIIFK